MTAERADNSKHIVALLVKRGQDAFDGIRGIEQFTPDPAANELVTDLTGHPHAFVIACVMDRQIKAERAWEIPQRIRERVGSFEFPRLRKFSKAELVRALREPTALHRYPETMGANMHAAIDLIARKYDGDASRIWVGRPSSAAVVLRFLEFPGVGPKIATMAANLLARCLKVPLGDYYSVDISVDRHVRRVLTRLGLISEGASTEEVVYTARALNPDFPGLIDLPAFDLGRTACGPRKPHCGECYLQSLCPTASD